MLKSCPDIIVIVCVMLTECPGGVRGSGRGDAVAVRVRGDVCARDAVWDTAVLTAPETLRHLISTTQRHLPECREGECVSDVVVLILVLLLLL